MRVLVAPGSYKGTLKSIVATDIIANTVLEVLPNALIEKLVLADGGEGTLETFSTHFGCITETYSIRNPVGAVIDANLGFLREDTSVIETSQAIGLSLIAPSERNPFMTSSYGVGELIKHAVRRGAKHILVTMGDSATMDMGIGMLHALGVKFYSVSGEIIFPTLNNLNQIIDFDDGEIQNLRDNVIFVGLADTDDYLCGEIGQVRLFGKQKGLPESQIPSVELAYVHFSQVIQRRFGVDVTRVIRASGSGGLAATLYAFLKADLVNTLDYLSRKMQLDSLFGGADLVVTGEGCLDNQTKLGKVPHFVASRTVNKCIGIVGSFTQEGLDDLRRACRQFSIFCINPAIAMTNPRHALREAVLSVFSLVK